jgi:hypothetical protein
VVLSPLLNFAHLSLFLLFFMASRQYFQFNQFLKNNLLGFTPNLLLGERNGQACAVKVFKSGSVYEASYFKTEMDVIEAAMSIIIFI